MRSLIMKFKNIRWNVEIRSKIKHTRVLIDPSIYFDQILAVSSS